MVAGLARLSLTGSSPDSRTPCVSPGNFLFFGCRQRDQDFYWEPEWKELEKRGCLTLVTAFSREQVGVQRAGAGEPGAGGWGYRLTPVCPACRSRRCTCSTGSGNSGRWCGSCWTTRVLTSTSQGEPEYGLGGSQPSEGPSLTEPPLACPSSNAKYMPVDVSEALMSIFQEEGGLSSPDAAAYLARLQRTLRFQTETWA